MNRTGRVMNSQMNISLPVALHELLRDLAWQERKPLSHLCRDLIEAGMQAREGKRRRREGRGRRGAVGTAAQLSSGNPPCGGRL